VTATLSDYSFTANISTALLNMLLGNKLKQRSIHSATRILWDALFTFERYYSLAASCSLVDSNISSRIERPSLDSRLRHPQVVADTKVHRDAEDLVVDTITWPRGAGEVDDKSTSPTFVTSILSPLSTCSSALY
jgi:hypothetical protein